MPAEEIKDDEEFKRFFGKPEFMPASEGNIRGLVEDKEGNTWVFLDSWRNWGYRPYAAVLRIQDKSIEIAMRAQWMDDPDHTLSNGDSSFIICRDWMKITGLSKPFKDGGTIVVKLPFRPETISLVDK